MTKERVHEFSQQQAEPSWLTELRLQAVEQLDHLDLPVIERVKFHRWNLGDGSLELSPAVTAVPDFTELGDNPMLVQVGSHTVLEQLPASLVEQGVVFTDFASAMEQIPDVLKTYLGTVVVNDEHKLAAYNTAYFNATAVLYVPDNVEIDQPVEALFYQDSTSTVAFNKRVLIVAGKNSKLHYLERFESLGQGQTSTSANILVEVVALAGSQIKFAAIDRLGQQVDTYLNRRAEVGPDASIDWAIGLLNEGNVIADLDTELRGNGSYANLKVVGLSAGRQVQGVDTRVTNYGHNSVGHILQHGVILEKATLTFNGIGHIVRGAKGADAQQESRVLMLSDKARSDANPILLIDENEVTAGHAASIGQVDPEDMYYLMSRGLDRATAERLVIRGFLGAVITEIPVREVREELIAVIDEKLANRN